MGGHHSGTPGARDTHPAAHGSDVHRRRADLRLVVPALAAWAGAAGAGLVPPTPAVLWTAATFLIAVLLGGAYLVRRVRRVRRPGVRWPAAAVLSGTACLAAAVLSAGLPARARAVGPLAEHAGGRVTATIEGKVTADPHIRDGSGSTLVIVPVRVERLIADGREVRLREPVLVLATGSGWETLLPSQRIRTTGKLAPPRGADTVAAVLFVRSPPAVIGGPSAVQRTAADLRQGLRDAAAGLDGPRRGLLPGLVVGDTSNLDEEVREDFRTAGMSHLVAVSGANCAIVITAAMVVIRRTRLGPALQAVVVATALLGFIILARPSPSVLRAGLMGFIGILAAGTGRSRQAVPALGATVLVLVLANPGLALSVGFTLSVAATAGLVILAPDWRDRLSTRMPRWLAEAVSVATAAHVACSPVLVAVGAGVSLVSIPANMLAAPAVAPATILGVLATVAAVFSEPLARVLATLAGLPCGWLITVADIAARVPGAEISWPDGPFGALALTTVTIVLSGVIRRRTAVRWRTIAGSPVAMARDRADTRLV